MSEEILCFECYEKECKDNTFCGNAAQCYQSHYVESTDTEVFSSGCIVDASKVPLLCTSSFENAETYFKIKCCNTTLCNNATFTSFYSQDEYNSNFWLYTGLSLGGLACFAFVITLSIFMLRRYMKKRRLKFQKGSSKTKSNKMYIDESKLPLSGDSCTREALSESVTSGSGSGLPLFIQRTLAKNITMESIVGKGRYGEVWKGIWQGEDVAVKIFFTRDESSWARETEIYSTVLLRHENILGFYGSDVTSVASCTQLWLITHYHPERSLYDYLQKNSLDHSQLMNICNSLISGLNHLHTEILGTQGKPAIAHRDVTSKNVLMKSDGACCIADLGLAVIRVQETAEINISSGSRIGTKRYMSPEMLDGSLKAEHFDSFRKVDMFAAAIVMWEAAMRCVNDADNTVYAYEIPYGDIFPYEPTFDEMMTAVSHQNIRPRIPAEWAKDHLMSSLLHIITECWHRDSEVRLTSLRVKKNLSLIASQENIDLIV